MTVNELGYFESLFQKLGPEKEQGYAYPVVVTNGDVIQGVDSLKDYMFAILKSNMQYDFGINFDDNDVLDFAKAITDYITQTTIDELVLYKNAFDLACEEHGLKKNYYLKKAKENNICLK